MSVSSTAPFIAQPVGSVADATWVAALAAKHWALPQPELIRASMNAIFRAGPDVVLRVGRPTGNPDAAIWLADELRAHGVAVPRIARPEPFVVGHLCVLAIEFIQSVGSIDWQAVGHMIQTVHRMDPAAISVRYPLATIDALPAWQFDRLLNDVGPSIDRKAFIALQQRIVALNHRDQWAGTVCHGDIHPGNVIQSIGGPVLLDWDLMCTATPHWDHGPLMRWHERWGGEPGAYESFAKGYGVSFRGDPTAEAMAELRLAAATLMRCAAAIQNRAAQPEASLRLRYWLGEQDSPAWTSQ